MLFSHIYDDVKSCEVELIPFDAVRMFFCDLASSILPSFYCTCEYLIIRILFCSTKFFVVDAPSVSVADYRFNGTRLSSGCNLLCHSILIHYII